MGEDKSSQIPALLITGLLAILGTVAGSVMKGYWENTLADKKFQTDLVMKALEAEEQESRVDSLRFMIDTNLIVDPSIKTGLERYLSEKPEASVPRIRYSVPTFSPGIVVPTTDQNWVFTDYNVFVCDVSFESTAARSVATAIIDALSAAGRVGQIELKAWRLYDEIPLVELKDKVTIVADTSHPEAGELVRLKRVLGGIDGLPEIQVIDNRGRSTPWLISIVVCPTQ